MKMAISKFCLVYSAMTILAIIIVFIGWNNKTGGFITNMVMLHKHSILQLRQYVQQL